MDTMWLVAFFGWCSVINIGILLFWFIFIFFLPELTFRLTSKFIAISKEDFNRFNYLLVGLFKIAVIILNISPYIALKLAF